HRRAAENAETARRRQTLSVRPERESKEFAMLSNSHFRPAVTRRDVLVRAAHGFGSLALASLLPAQKVNPLAAKASHFAAKAKSVIFLFMVGGPSQVDT